MVREAPGMIGRKAGEGRECVFLNEDTVGRSRIAEAGTLLDMNRCCGSAPGCLSACDSTSCAVQTSGTTERNVRRSGQSDRCATQRHPVLRCRDSGYVVGGTRDATDCSCSNRGRAHGHATHAGDRDHPTGDGTGMFHVLVAQSHHRQDRATTVSGFGDRIDTQIRDEC